MRTFSTNADMLIIVKKNLTTVLSERLNEANDVSNMHLHKIQELEKRVGVSLGGDDDDDDMYEDDDE